MRSCTATNREALAVQLVPLWDLVGKGRVTAPALQVALAGCSLEGQGMAGPAARSVPPPWPGTRAAEEWRAAPAPGTSSKGAAGELVWALTTGSLRASSHGTGKTGLPSKLVQSLEAKTPRERRCLQALTLSTRLVKTLGPIFTPNTRNRVIPILSSDIL